MCNQPQTVAGPVATRRGGFTLVELLVVILIVGMLAALVTPAVIQALTKARNTAIKAEIDMLHMAVMNYKNEYGSFPPAFDPAMAVSGPAVRHLTRSFPRAAADDLRVVLTALTQPIGLTPANALPLWLEGYSKNPANPLLPADQRQRVFDFDRARIANLGMANAYYHPEKLPDSLYIYFDRSNYGVVSGSVGSITFTAGSNTYQAQVDPRTGRFFNEDSFQLLCAGRDGEWNTDDDVSNFWPSTRGDFRDTLKK